MLPSQITNLIDYVIYYVGDTTSDWFLIKKELINVFPPVLRKNFSKRHHSTKKHILNSFDKEVITYWENTTGNTIWVNPEKLHPENWQPKPKGWGLQEYNEKRRTKI